MGRGSGLGDIELLELDPALPNLPQEILEHLDGELLAWAAAIAEAEGCEAGMVADGQRFAVNDTESRAEAAVVDGGLAAVFHLEGRALEGAAREANLVARVAVDIVAGRRVIVAIGIERLRIFPLRRIEAGRFVRRHDIAEPLVRRRPHLG